MVGVGDKTLRMADELIVVRSTPPENAKLRIRILKPRPTGFTGSYLWVVTYINEKIK